MSFVPLLCLFFYCEGICTTVVSGRFVLDNA